jgi:hypothetical protein
MRFGWIIAFAAFLVADPAAADITARYRQGNGEADMVLQVNDRGDSRMTVTEATYVTRDGITYMLVRDSQGSFVARQEDFLALMAALLRATGEPPASTARVAISEGGPATVAGRTGRLFRLGNRDTPSDSFDVVISTDGDLAPLTAVMIRHLVPFFETMGRSNPELAAAARDVLGRGAVLRFGPLFELESAATAPVPAAAFDLPSPPISRDALAQRLQNEASR